MNLYAHFPFCRRKCAYCALYSRTGVSQADRDAYVVSLAEEIARDGARAAGQIGAGLPPTANYQLSTTNYSTVYFGGGSPALCNLRPLFSALRLQSDVRSSVPLPLLTTTSSCEFTVELHPLDVTEERLSALRSGGVNRISMGVQSFDDATLAAMGRGYTADEALRAFGLVKRFFDNAGIDLIVGFPGDPGSGRGEWLKRFADLGMRHCSVYSLQNERGLENVPDDDVVLDGIKEVAGTLSALGLGRYEISNYAVPGYECRHNLAVWRGEDYLGLGEGACGRSGLARTRGLRGGGYSTETVTEAEDLKERTVFRLRTREGLDTTRFPEWRPILDRFVSEGLLERPEGAVYRLTPRGGEVCDSILAEIV